MAEEKEEQHAEKIESQSVGSETHFVIHKSYKSMPMK